MTSKFCWATAIQ